MAVAAEVIVLMLFCINVYVLRRWLKPKVRIELAARVIQPKGNRTATRENFAAATGCVCVSVGWWTAVDFKHGRYSPKRGESWTTYVVIAWASEYSLSLSTLYALREYHIRVYLTHCAHRWCWEHVTILYFIFFAFEKHRELIPFWIVVVSFASVSLCVHSFFWSSSVVVVAVYLFYRCVCAFVFFHTWQFVQFDTTISTSFVPMRPGHFSWNFSETMDT